VSKSRVIRDPVYGYISLPSELAPVVDHPLVQRLGRVAQTSMTSSVYPSATGSRFEHALGAMHLSRRAWLAAWNNGSPAQAEFTAAVGTDFPALLAEGAHQLAMNLSAAVGCVALLHDVGHPPLSHILEPYFAGRAAALLADRPDELIEFQTFPSQFHEFAGVVLTRELVKELPENLRKATLSIYEADPDDGTWAGTLHSIVAGEVDVDRLDYLMRDAQKAGTEFGAIDYERLVDAMELHVHDGTFRIAPGVRARSAVETLLLQRSQSYRWIAYHPRVVSTNAAVGRALDALDDLAEREDSGLRGAIDALMPNVNYIAPSATDIARATLAAQLPPEPTTGQVSILEQEAAHVTQRLATEVQAGVDDGTVLEALKRASLLCAQRRPQLTEPALSSAVQVLTFAHVALYREKSALPVWKTQDEFAAAVVHTEGFLPALAAVTREVHEEAASSSPNTDVRSIFESRRDSLMARLDSDPVMAFNEIAHDVFSSQRMRRSLEQRLNTAHPDLRKMPGYWAVEYTRFQPVRTAGQLSVLYRGDEPIQLRATSPVLHGLESVETLRPRLAVFFFLAHPGSAAAWGPDEGREARAWLVGRLFDLLPQFLREGWADHLGQQYDVNGQQEPA
jgi:HD superfamily phosphohydrolase